MVERWRDGYHCSLRDAHGQTGETRFKLFTAKIFYRL